MLGDKEYSFKTFLGRVEGLGGVKVECFISEAGSFWLYVYGVKGKEPRWIVVPADEFLRVLRGSEGLDAG